MIKKPLLIPLILFIYLVIIVLYHVFGYIGHYGFDDLHYAKLSANLVNGIVDLDDHFTFRFPLILLTSLSYFLFGISDFASSLPALLISASILAIVYFILKHKDAKTLIIGLSLTTFSNWFIFYSDKLMPDIYVALSVISVLAIIYRYKYHSKKKQPILYAFLVSISLLFGFMSKGTIVLILPLLLYYVIVDIIYKRDLKFWLYNFITGIIVLALYFFIIWLLTGDVMKRFDSIADNAYLNLCSYDKQSTIILLRRLSYGFFTMSIFQGMITGFIFTVAVFFRKKTSYYFKLNDSFSFFLVSSIVLFLSSNFMTISLTSYSPMCLDPRHYLFFIPVVSIPAAQIITQFIDEKKYKLQILIILAIVAVISYYTGGNTFWKLYFPITVLSAIYVFLRKRVIYQNIFLVLFVLILLLKPFDLIRYAQEIKYWQQKEILSEYVLDKDEDCLVITNEVQARLAEHYSNYDKNAKTKFIEYKEFKTDTNDKRKKLLFLKWHTRYLSQMDMNDLPYYAKSISSSNKLIYENEELNMAIYEMTDFMITEITRQTLISTLNDFERAIPNWNQNNNDISAEIKYEGEKSIEVNEYSSYFEYPLDSLKLTNSGSLLIRCSLYCYFEDKTNSKIVVLIKNDAGAYIWHGLEINKYLKAYSNWWPVQYEVMVNCSELKNCSRLKVFLWNIDTTKGFIDNFDVRVIEINN